MRCFDGGAATHNGIAGAQHEEELSADGESGYRFNIAAGEADVTQIAEDRRSAFVAAQFNATSHMETLLGSPGSWHVLHGAPCIARRLPNRSSTGKVRCKL